MQTDEKQANIETDRIEYFGAKLNRVCGNVQFKFASLLKYMLDNLCLIFFWVSKVNTKKWCVCVNTVIVHYLLFIL